MLFGFIDLNCALELVKQTKEQVILIMLALCPTMKSDSE